MMSQNLPVPGDTLLENAVQVSILALSEDGKYPASARLAAYYRPDGNYAGESFAEMDPGMLTTLTPVTSMPSPCST